VVGGFLLPPKEGERREREGKIARFEKREEKKPLEERLDVQD